MAANDSDLSNWRLEPGSISSAIKQRNLPLLSPTQLRDGDSVNQEHSEYTESQKFQQQSEFNSVLSMPALCA